jgi:hypothetical protein
LQDFQYENTKSCRFIQAKFKKKLCFEAAEGFLRGDYLVAAEVSEEEEFRSELSRLSTSFGIGVIKLNLEDPHSSEIVFPAKSREVLDWETINKLTMNSDFKEFISTVKIDITSKKIHKKEYDPVVDIETLKRRPGV